MTERVSRRLRIHGRVQGVWFRESMRKEAEARGITGWVRNRLDGTVEATVQGVPADVDSLIAWARQGPRDAQVRRVEVEDDSGGDVFAAFEKRPSA
jgi:acylphosphatase